MAFFVYLLLFLGATAWNVNTVVTPKVVTVKELKNAGWTTSPASLDQPIRLSFALKMRNREQLVSTLYEVSYPNSPSYGKHLTESEVTKIVAPADDTIATVVSFLARYGITEYSLLSNKCFLVAYVPAAVAVSMFDISPSSLVQLSHSNGQVVRFHSTEALKLPISVKEVIDYVSGISTRLPILRRKPIKSTAPLVTTVSDLKSLYSIDVNYNASNPKYCTQSVGEFQYQWFDPKDTQIFFQKYSQNNIGRAVVKINGTNNPALAGGEASLDVEYIMAMGSNCATSFYYISDGTFIESLIDYFVVLNSEADPEKMNSVSFGTNGDEPSDVVQRLDDEIVKLGSRGVTVTFASGDNGVGCENGKNEPDFPNSPHILMVGATDRNGSGEISAKLSSGGFSDDYPIADYQTAEVAAYFKTAASSLPPASQYNANGRGFPDISAIGVNLPIIVRGQEEDASGTSFSSPIVAGILSLLNDIRVSAGKSTLGYFNPLLYQIARDHPEAFQDITTGPKNADGACQGFSPSVGWDPVTGLGTPNFQVFAKYINDY